MITLKKPSFWADSPSLMDRFTACVLWPISLLYKAGSALHVRRHQSSYIPHDNDVTVICVGNLTVGGTGKTPVVMALYNDLQQQGYSPVILSKGYGGSIKAPSYVDPQHHNAEQVGDEALMMTKRGHGVIISDNRKDGVTFAQAQGHKMIIMDDGLQNVHVKADINLCVIDGVYGLGNGFCLPAGPLRQSFASALSCIDAFIVNRTASPALKARLDITKKPIFSTQFIMNDIATDHDYHAFAGIGDPNKFYGALRDKGLNIKETTDFPDHHVYSKADVDALKKQAKSNHTKLITTEKDSMKFADDKDITIAKGQLKFTDVSPLQKLIADTISQKSGMTS